MYIMAQNVFWGKPVLGKGTLWPNVIWGEPEQGERTLQRNCL